MTKPIAVIHLERDNFDLGNPRDEYENIGTLYTWHNRYPLGGKLDYNNQPKIHNKLFWIYEEFELHKLPELQQFNVIDDTLYILDEENEEVEADYNATSVFQDTIITWMEENLCILPVYMYDHSGITINTKPFSCMWDSGQVGFIYATKEHCNRLGVNFTEAEKILEGEIQLLDQYLTGDVWNAESYLCDEAILDDEDENLELYYEDENLQIYTSNKPPKNEFVIEEDSCCGIYGYKEALEYNKDMAKALVKYNPSSK